MVSSKGGLGSGGVYNSSGRLMKKSNPIKNLTRRKAVLVVPPMVPAVVAAVLRPPEHLFCLQCGSDGADIADSQPLEEAFEQAGILIPKADRLAHPIKGDTWKAVKVRENGSFLKM